MIKTYLALLTSLFAFITGAGSDVTAVAPSASPTPYTIHFEGAIAGHGDGIEYTNNSGFVVDVELFEFENGTFVLQTFKVRAGQTLSKEIDVPYASGDVYVRSNGNQGSDGIDGVCILDCFVGSTLVQTPHGATQIQEIEPGDTVLVGGGERQSKVARATSSLVHNAVELTLGSDKIVASRGHRFLVAGRGLVEAKSLKVGDQLCLFNGRHKQVDSVEHQSLRDGLRVFNLVLEQGREYVVGSAGVRVESAKE